MMLLQHTLPAERKLLLRRSLLLRRRLILRGSSQLRGISLLRGDLLLRGGLLLLMLVAALETAQAQGTSSLQLQSALVGSVSQMDSAAALSRLKEALSDPDWGVRSTAATLLLRRGDDAALVLYRQIAAPMFRSAAAGGDAEVRAIAMRALGADPVSAKQAAAELTAGATAAEPAVRKYALWALGLLDDADARAALRAAARDGDWEIRQFAARGLGRSHSADTTAVLEELLSDPFPPVRWDAVRSLSGHKKAVPALRRALSDSDDSVRRAAGKALAEMGEELRVEVAD